MKDIPSPSELRLLSLAFEISIARALRPRHPQLTRTAGVHPREALFTEEDLREAFSLGVRAGAGL